MNAVTSKLDAAIFLIILHNLEILFSVSHTSNVFSFIKERKNKLHVTFLVCHCINQLIQMQENNPLHYVHANA